METLLYLAKVNLCWLLFYVCYWLLFRRHTFFRWNRAYLLVSLLISFAIPLVTFTEQTVVVPQIPHVEAVNSYIPNIETTVVVSAEARPSPNWSVLLYTLYLAGAVFFLFRLIKGLLNITTLFIKNERIPFEDYTLILLPHSDGSFSFFKWLMVSQQDYEQHLDTVLRHELVHIRQMHSFDVLLIEVVKVIFWFNPVLWLYKKSLQEVHEFLADEAAPNRECYATFLIGYGMHSPLQSLTNQFFNSSLLKSRIKMIYKNRTSRWLLGKYLMIIPVLLLLVSLTAAREHILTSETPVDQIEKPIEEIERPDQTADLDPKIVKNILKTEETINIKGEIINKSGLPIRNATLVVKNTKMGTSTDRNGHFEFKSIPADSKIVVSHVSYKPAEFNVEKSKNEYSIELLPEENIIDEVVVVSFKSAEINQGGRDSWDTRKRDSNKEVIVEKKAEFPGGMDELLKYVGRNVKYPTAALRANVTGSVFVSFVVNEFGHVQKAEIIKGLGFGMDQEATRVVWSMPKWSPAIQNGEAVPSQHTIPIKFQIEASSESKEKRQGFINYPKLENLQLAKADLKTFKFENNLTAISSSASTDNGTFVNYKLADLKTHHYYHKYGK
jgi:TonB family protein